MSGTDPTRCTNCHQLQARVDALEAELAAIKEVVARLSRQLAAARKDSSTSSKPPSSDIVKPPKPPPPQGQDKRRIGGQPGHPKHDRVAFPAESINGGAFDHRLDSCPSCGQDLTPALTIAPRVVQQVDIVEVPLSIQEHRSHPGWCPRCQKMYEAPLPHGIERGGLVGPSLTTLIAYLKGACHASYSTVRKFLRDVVRVTISRGELARIIAKVGRALERPYQELLDDLPGQARLNVDETGHKQNGQRQWTWCFRAGLYTLFKIDPTRGADVLIEVLRCGTRDVPETRLSRNLARRFEAHGESYFRFVTTPGIEPTNNLAEQAIRFVVIDRLVTQGTRSEAGNRWCERIWTAIATCVQQGRSVFAYLEAAVGAWFDGAEAPSLLPGG